MTQQESPLDRKINDLHRKVELHRQQVRELLKTIGLSPHEMLRDDSMHFDGTHLHLNRVLRDEHGDIRIEPDDKGMPVIQTEHIMIEGYLTPMTTVDPDQLRGEGDHGTTDS